MTRVKHESTILVERRDPLTSLTELRLTDSGHSFAIVHPDMGKEAWQHAWDRGLAD